MKELILEQWLLTPVNLLQVHREKNEENRRILKIHFSNDYQ